MSSDFWSDNPQLQIFGVELTLIGAILLLTQTSFFGQAGTLLIIFGFVLVAVPVLE